MKLLLVLSVAVPLAAQNVGRPDADPRIEKLVAAAKK